MDAEKISKDIKLIFDFLKEEGRIKTQKDLADAIGRSPSCINRAINDTEGMLPTAKTVRAELLNHFRLKIKNDIVSDDSDTRPFSNENASINEILTRFVGKYGVQWTKIDDGLLRIYAEIEVFTDGKATFLVNSALFEGIFFYKQGYLYFEFENITEKFYLMCKVGITLNKNLIKYLSGIMTGIEAKWDFLYSSYAILYSLEQEKIEEERINLYFKYVLSKRRIETDKNMTLILDTRVAISHPSIQKIFSSDNDCPLKGKWDRIGLLKGGNSIRVGKMEVFDFNNVIYTGVPLSNYIGTIEMKGDDIYMYLYGDKRNSIHVATLSYINVAKVTSVFVGFVTVNPNERGSVMGINCLIRETAKIYADTPIGEYDKEHEIYKYYESTGIIKNLQVHYFKNSIETD